MNCPSCRAPNPDAAATCGSCGRELGRRVVGPGSRVASRYELLSELGHGGMGTVFKAHDLSLDEIVALKVLRGDTPPDPGMAQRFRSEVKLAWRVRHRNVCGIHEYGEDGDLLYISMELVEGRDLKAILRDQGALPWEEAYDVALQAAEGLQAIHASGVIHRDLKPANIIRDADALVRLMDFGIAKAFGDEAQSVTRTGQVVGSPEYMSPEQWRGQELDFRSDIYALGVAIFELFTGHPPFQGESAAAVMLKHLQSPPPLEGPDASRIPSALLPVLGKALAKDPADRYGTCHEMLAALRAARDALGSQLTDGVGPSASGPEDDVQTLLVDRAPAAALASASRQPVPGKRGPSGHSRYAKRLVPVLTRALSHERASVRAGAARAMARIGPDASAAAEALATAASDTDTDVRNAAAAALELVAPQGEPASGASAPETSGSQPAPASPEASTPPPAAATPSQSSGWTVPPPVRPPPPPPSPAPAPRHPRDPAGRRGEGQRLFPTSLVVAVVSVLAAVTVLVVLLRRREEAPSTPLLSPAATLAPTPAPEPTAGVGEPALSPPTPVPAAAQPTTAPTPAAEPARGPSPRSRATPSAVAARATATLAPPSPTPPPSATIVPEPTPAPVVSSTPEAPAVTPTPAPPPPTREVVLPAECLRCPTPPFPEIAQRLGVKGRVRLRLDVDEQGIVTRALVLEGPRELAEGAAKAVKKWTYRPATRNGVPIPDRVEVHLEFR